MRALLFRSLLITAALITGGTCLVAAGPANQTVKIINGSRSDWRIASPPPSSPGATWAAKELQQYLQQITGCKLIMVKRTPNRPALVVGLRHELTPEDRALLPPAPAGYDGYAIAVHPATRKRPARIVIAGANGRGVIYGVYDLLERFGCRWFYPDLDPDDPQIVPRSESLSLTAGSWAVASPVKYRVCDADPWVAELGAKPALQQMDWAMKTRYNAMGWQTHFEPTIEGQLRRFYEHGYLSALTNREMLLYGPGRDFQFLPGAQEIAKSQPGRGFSETRMLYHYYADNSAHSWVIPPLTQLIASDRQSLRQADFDSIYLLMSPRGCWWNHGFNAYLAGRCLYDYSLSASQTLRDYALLYFGAKAGPLLAEYLEDWAKNPELGYRVRADARSNDCATLTYQRRRWLAPALDLVKNEAVHAHRLAKTEKLHTLAEQSMKIHRQHAEIQTLRRAGRFETARARLAEARVYAGQVLELSLNLANLNQGLLDGNFAAAFVSRHLQRWLDEEAEAITENRRD